MKYIILIILLIITGCSALREQTAEYVENAVKERISNQIDEVLDKRGLSLQTIQAVFDADNNNATSIREITDTLKSSTRDVVMLEAQNYVDTQIEENNKKLESNVINDIDSKKLEIWNMLLLMISGYLGKQVWSAKNDGKRDMRISVLEKVLNRDLDKDGKIGTVNENEQV